MSFPSRRIALSLAGVVALAVTLAVTHAYARSGTAATSDPAHRVAERAYAAEVARIRQRFDTVLAELRAPVARPLSPAQREARALRLETLQRYRDAGVFPHNHTIHERATPFFVDHRGVVCAVGHLLLTSGRRDLVERVRAADNNVWVAALATDTAFTRWLDASGLTLAEAARIQVPYMGTPEEPRASATSRRVNTAAAVLAGGLGAASIAWNVRAPGGDHRRVRSVLGLTAGAAGLAIAASRRDAESGPRAVGLTTGAIGLGSIVMATRTLLRGPESARVASRTRPGSPDVATISVAPTMGTAGDRLAPGLSMRVRF